MANLNEDQAPKFAKFSTTFPDNRKYMTEVEFRKRMEDQKGQSQEVGTLIAETDEINAGKIFAQPEKTLKKYIGDFSTFCLNLLNCALYVFFHATILTQKNEALVATSRTVLNLMLGSNVKNL